MRPSFLFIAEYLIGKFTETGIDYWSTTMSINFDNQTLPN